MPQNIKGITGGLDLVEWDLQYSCNLCVVVLTQYTNPTLLGCVLPIVTLPITFLFWGQHLYRFTHHFLLLPIIHIC